VQRKAQKRGVKSVKCTVKERESERVVRHTTVTAMTESAKGVVIEGRRVEKTRCVSTCVCVCAGRHPNHEAQGRAHIHVHIGSIATVCRSSFQEVYVAGTPSKIK
jgi:pyruvate/2-oxoglutarate dehydrogenase complex dihydrolipoamide dehydrogenase (E3) component